MLSPYLLSLAAMAELRARKAGIALKIQRKQEEVRPEVRRVT